MTIAIYRGTAWVISKILSTCLIEKTTTTVQRSLYRIYISLSNSRGHSANADVIADVTSKIIVSRRHFFADVILSDISKVQNYQNKTGKKSLYRNKYVLTTYFKEFQRYFRIYNALLFIFSKL